MCNNIGEILKSLREKKDLSIREVARRTGISHSYLSQVENGKRNIAPNEKLQRLAAVLDIEYSRLVSLIRENVGSVIQNKEQSNNNHNSIDELNFSLVDKLIPITIEIPAEIDFKDKNGVTTTKGVSPNDVFDIFYFLNMNVDLYYKGEKITKEEKQKILTLISTVLD